MEASVLSTPLAERTDTHIATQAWSGSRQQIASPLAAPLRILMATARYAPFVGGTETHVREVAHRLTAAGHEVTVLTTDPGGDLPAEEWEQRVRMLRVRAYPRTADLYFAPALARIVGNGDWDLVHCQGYSTFVAPLAMLAAARARLPYVLTFHSGGHSSPLRNLVRGTQRQVLRPLLARADRLIAVSQFEVDFFSQRLRLPRERFVVVPNGAHLPTVTATDPAPAPAGQLIVASGRLERYKGHQRLIAALPAVRTAYPDARLRIAGTGPYEPELRRLVAELHLEGVVEIGGIPASDRAGMASLLSSAALVTLLSDYEAHPIAVLEAVALGRPVLVTRTSGLAELADRGLAQAIPLDSTTAQIAAAIIEQLRAPIAPATVTLPTWDDCAAQLLDLYGTIARRPALARRRVA